SSNFADAFDGLGIGFVPDLGGQSTNHLTATLDLSCSGIEDVTSVRISGPWWGWDPNGGPEATEVSEGLWQVIFDPAPGADMEYKWVINGEYEDLLDFGEDLLYGDGYDDYLNGACAPITDYFSYANRLWTAGSGDINDTWGQCAACSQVASCGTLFLPTDAAWESAGYNLEALSQEVIGDLLAGHVFLGFCDALQSGEQLTNWYGEIFQFNDDGAGNRNIQSLISGDIYPIEQGEFSFDSGSQIYTLGGVIALASADPCLGCTELEMTGSIADYTVECESDLDAATAAADAAAFTCSDLPIDNVYSDKFQFDGRNQVENGGGTSQTWNVLTAGDDPNFNNGTDALLQFYDIDGNMGEAVYFVEDLSAGGVTLTQYENGTAILEGAVVDMDDPNRGLDLHFYFQNRTAGNAWGGGFKNDYGCAVNTDEWTMYVLNDDMSYATGRGDWQFGTLLRFNHQPASQYFGYQLGDGANNHNCDANGFSGWFNWSGAIAGEAAFGQAGDIIATLDPTVDHATDCQDGEFVEFHYVAYDELCNIAQLNIQNVTRDDVTAPTYVSGGDDITLDCAASDQWLMDNPADAEVILFSDNCDDSEYGCAAGFDPNTAGFADGDDVFVCVELVGETTTQYTASSCRTLQRTWVATDCFGNQAFHVQTITIEDNTAPEVDVTAPADITLNVNGLCYVDLDPSNTGEGTPSYSDNCDLADTGMSYSDLIVDSVSTGCYSIIRTWTVMATDSCGNASADSDNQRIDIQDLIAPSFSYLPVDTIECDLWGDCSYEYLNSIGLATAMDNCELSHVDVDCTPLSSACTDDYIVDYTAYDMCGNSTSIQQIVVTSDFTAPEFTFAPADLTLECSDASLTGDVDGYAVPEYTPGDGLHAEAMDNCDPEIFVTYEDVILSTACAQEYTIRRTYSVYDCDENLAQHVQDITIDDSTAPEFTTFPADVVDVECDAVPAVASIASLGTMDNCDGAPTTTYDGEVRTDGDCADSYMLERTWTTVDCAGNTHTQTQTITVLDTQAPEMTMDCPADFPHINECFGSGPSNVTFTFITDNYGAGEAFATITDSEGATVADYPLGYFADSDTTSETLTLDPGDYTITLGDDWGDGWAWAPATGEDAVVISGGAEGSLDFIDGNMVSMEFTVAGSGGGPTATTVYLDENCYADLSPEAIGYGTSEFSDDCDPNPTLDITYTDGPPTYDCGEPTGSYSFVRTWDATVTDHCGNSASATGEQLITVIDNSAPSLTLDCPNGANLINVCWADVDTSLAALGEVEWTALDNCDENLDVSYTYSDEVSFDCSMIGVDANPEGSYNFTRTFVVTAVDCNGNSTTESCTQTINTFDLTAPTIEITCPDTATVEHDDSCMADLDPSNTGSAFATATDDCDTEVDITYSYTDGAPTYTCGNGGYEFTRTWTATAEDDCGNESSTSCDQLIIVVDNIEPVASITCPADATVSLDENCEADLSTDALGMATGSGTDNCDSDVDMEITYEDAAPTYTCTGDDDQLDGSYSFVRTFTATATDDCGNTHSVSCDQTITVNDEIAPTQIFPNLATDTLYLDLDCYADLTPASIPAPETSDNCDSDVAAVVTYEDNAATFGSLFGEVTVEVETVAEHTDGDLAGMSTYRIYAVLPQEGDFLSSVSGEGSFSTQIRTSTSFYQHPLGASTPNFINPALYGGFPELEYDSYMTIGLDQQPDLGAGEGAINVAGNWGNDFENGGDVVLNGEFGGAWFALNGDANGFAGADRRVLVAQVTTDGIVNGQIFAQVFPQGDGANAQLFTATIGDGCEGDDATIEGSYVVSRLWTSMITDDCGNEDTAYAYQYIVVLDTIAPQFTNTCDIDNGETVEYTCGDDNGNGVNDIFDFIEIPAPCAPSYIENCDSEVALTMTSTESGYLPTDDISNYCMPTDPEAIANGETCDDRAPEAIRLFNFSGGESYTLVDGGSSIIEIMADSSMHIVMEVENAAGDAGFIFDAMYDGGHDWNEWLALPGMHNYKKDCAEIFPGIEIWTEWIYYIMDGGTMSGTGRYAGSEFALSHQPLNAYYGLQVGEGANNKNENYGASAWFFWTGEYVLDGASQGTMASSGDIFMDLDCCLGWQIDYEYTVVDDCGNSNGFSYTDLGTGDFGNSANSTVSGGHTPVDITAGTSSLKDPIRITGLQPNPTNDISTLGFVVSNNMRLRIDLYTMSGQFVQELFDGNASEDVQYVLDIDANTLSSGMYQVRLSSSDYVVVKKLLVSE
ncbi:MAG: T9SS type A sorting domain-containing protein, partial [Flavobacteriales bacterium]